MLSADVAMVGKRPLKSCVVIVLLWLMGGGISWFFAYLGVDFIGIEGEYTFYGPDSFYHATRILSAVGNLGEFYQYDARSEVWISWPWGYDWFLAAINTVICSNMSSCNPAAVLIHIPPAITFLNAALVLAIGSRLGLSIPFKCLLMLAYAFSPLVQELHFAGRIDHHMIELSFSLASLYLGLKWFQPDSTPRQAVVFGLVLGVATGFHNALFILQIPLLMALFICWCKKNEEIRTPVYFASALFLSQLLVLLPSLPFQNMWFSYLFHSWFHLYVAGCTSIVVLFFSFVSYTKKNFVCLCLISFVLLIPVFGQIVHGASFVTGKLDFFSFIGETTPPFAMSVSLSASKYSYLIFVFPLFMVAYFSRKNNRTSNADLYFLSASMFGSLLMLMQYRLNYFGFIFLFLPMLLVFDRAARQYRSHGFTFIGIALMILLLAYQPCLYWLYFKRPLGSVHAYASVERIYPELRRVCAENPGLVLADHNDGHFITYHTSCSVIGNNMMVSEKDFENIKSGKRMLDMTVEEFMNSNNNVKYIFVRRKDVFQRQSEISLEVANKGLRFELLIDGGHVNQMKPIIELRNESFLIPKFAGVYRVLREREEE